MKRVLIVLLVFSSFSVLGQNKINQVDSNGKKQGYWIEDNGYKECYYKNNLLHGFCKTYSKINHTLDALGEFDNGNYSGIWYFFDEKKGFIIGKFFDIEKNTDIIIVLDDGHTKEKPIYKAYNINYYPSGIIKEEGQILYDDSFEIDYYEYGLWKYYDEKGNLIKTVNKNR